MGIINLLPYLKQITKRVHISDFKGKRIAVDGFVWLHQAAFSCPKELYYDPKTPKILNYLAKRLKILEEAGITPIIVFDGMPLPAKLGTNIDRTNKRNEAIEKIKEIEKGIHSQNEDLNDNEKNIQEFFGKIEIEKSFERNEKNSSNDSFSSISCYEGEDGRSFSFHGIEFNPIQIPENDENYDLFSKAISIKYPTVRVFMDFLSMNKIPFIVAPYEADAQLAFLARSGIADAVLTIDSDLICYKTPVTLLKMDSAGMVDVIVYKEVLEFFGMNEDQFTQLCVLCSDVYCKHIRMIGIKTAINMMKEYGDGHKIIDVCLSNPKFTVPDNYKEAFDKAVFTFKHQRVFDPFKKDLVCLEPTDLDDPCIGPIIDRTTLLSIVSGKQSPFHGKINAFYTPLNFNISLPEGVELPPKCDFPEQPMEKKNIKLSISNPFEVNISISDNNEAFHIPMEKEEKDFHDLDKFKKKEQNTNDNSQHMITPKMMFQKRIKERSTFTTLSKEMFD